MPKPEYRRAKRVSVAPGKMVQDFASREAVFKWFHMHHQEFKKWFGISHESALTFTLAVRGWSKQIDLIPPPVPFEWTHTPIRHWCSSNALGTLVQDLQFFCFVITPKRSGHFELTAEGVFYPNPRNKR